MIQKKFIELKKEGCWCLYRVEYYYRNQPSLYYELHKKNLSTGADDVLRFGKKNMRLLIQMLHEFDVSQHIISDIKVIGSERVLIGGITK